MQIFVVAEALLDCLKQYKNEGKKIGFVPTMGALHQGHISLVASAKIRSDITVVSIFVNPTQFNNPEDFRLYPAQPEKDIALLEKAGCDVLFMPAPDEVYPHGTQQLKTYDLGFLEQIMEGKFRPGHFQGVCQVVDRLLEIVHPDILFLGRKDLQQCKVVERLLALTGKSHEIQLEICPTMREADGLAMSSRNLRLSAEERKKAALIYKALTELKETFGQADFEEKIKSTTNQLEDAGFLVEYLEIVDSQTLEIANKPSAGRNITACIAVFLGKVRLIDNMILYTVQ